MRKAIILGSDRQADKVFDMLTEVMGRSTNEQYIYIVSRQGRRVSVHKTKNELWKKE